MAEINGGTTIYSHSFSKAQMDTFKAIIDTFIPCITQITDDGGEVEDGVQDDDDEKMSFYRRCASQIGVGAQAAWMMCSKLKVEELEGIKLLLWLLWTRLGTLLMVGKVSLEAKPPFVRSFSEIPSVERQKLVLNSCSLPSSLLKRSIFDAFKAFTTFNFFTKVDQAGRNPSWGAIGYCGPDPAAVAARKSGGAATKPLQNAVIPASVLNPHQLAASLQRSGFQLLCHAELRRLHSTSAARRRSFPLTPNSLAVTCDAVVVGSGCGGGVAAAILAQAGYRVLVVEKGSYYSRDDLSLLEGDSLESMYEGGGLLATDDNNVLLLAGATVGGGTAINWSASFETPPQIRREWSQDLGLRLFEKNGEYDAAMDAVLRRLSVRRPSTPSPPPPPRHNLQNTVLRRGCERLGYHCDTVERNNGAAEHSCGWCGFGCWSGEKQATSETWLVDAVATGRTSIITGFEATGILLREAAAAEAGGDARKGRRVAVGVRGKAGEADLFIEAGVTVVSCGALNTPILLQRSGLRNPHIGKHLHLHPVQMMWGYFPRPAAAAAEDETIIAAGTSYEGGIITAVSKEFARHLHQTITPTSNGIHNHDPPPPTPPPSGCILQCPSLHPGVFSILTPWLSGEDYKRRMEKYSRTVTVFALARDKGEGSVEWRWGRRRVLYRLQKEDEEGLAEGGVGALRVLAAAGAAEIGTMSRQGERLRLKEAAAEGLEAFLDRVRRRPLSGLGVPLCSAHQMGSCRMGSTPETSVVAPDGGVWEASSLYIADSSVLPTSMGINPMITIQSVAFCIASSAVRHLQSASKKQL